MTLTSIIEEFKASKTCGVKVLVLPPGMEKEESSLVWDVIGRSFTEKETVVARAEPKGCPRQSVRDALINGYSAMKGGSSRIAAFLNKSQGAIGSAVAGLSGVAIAGMLAKLGINAITNSPVTPLQKQPPYGVEAVWGAISEICDKGPLVIHVRKAYEDAQESWQFLCDYCGNRLNTLGDKRSNLLVVISVREQDLKKKHIKEQLAELDNVQLINLSEETAEEGRESLLHTVRVADRDARVILIHVAAFAFASDSNLFDPRVIRIACKLGDSGALDWLREHHVLEALSTDDSHGLWTIAEAYDRWDLRDAVVDIQQQESEEVIDAELPGHTDAEDIEADERDGANEFPDDTAAAANLFDAVAEVYGETPATLDLLFNLADDGNRGVEGARIAGLLIDHDAATLNHSLLESKIPKFESFFESLLCDRECLELTGEVASGLAECMQRLTSALRTLQAFPWGPVRGTLGSILLKLITTFSPTLSKQFAEESTRVAEREAGYLHVLTDKGRVKLVPISNSRLQAVNRSPSTLPSDCIRNPNSDGAIWELRPVQLAQMAWFFGTDGNVVAIPLSVIDAVDDEQSIGCTENMSVYLRLSEKWERTGLRFSSSCAFDPSVPPKHVLLANELGHAITLNAETLPKHPGEHVAIDFPESLKANPPRWSVPFAAQDDVFVASSGSLVLRLKAAELISRGLSGNEQIISLAADERVAAIAAVSADSKSSVSVFIATEGGYGKIVQITDDEFPYRHLGAKGVIGQKVGKRSGSITTIQAATESSQFILGSSRGRVARLFYAGIPLRHRNATGLRLLALDEGERILCACAY